MKLKQEEIKTTKTGAVIGKYFDSFELAVDYLKKKDEKSQRSLAILSTSIGEKRAFIVIGNDQIKALREKTKLEKT